jgi:hypothetical protein
MPTAGMRPSRLLKLFEPSVLSQPWSMISGPDPSNYGDYGGAFNLTNKYWLVVLTILKNMIVSWEGLSHILWKNKKCSKPPTRQFNG